MGSHKIVSNFCTRCALLVIALGRGQIQAYLREGRGYCFREECVIRKLCHSRSWQHRRVLGIWRIPANFRQKWASYNSSESLCADNLNAATVVSLYEHVTEVCDIFRHPPPSQFWVGTGTVVPGCHFPPPAVIHSRQPANEAMEKETKCGTHLEIVSSATSTMRALQEDT